MRSFILLELTFIVPSYAGNSFKMAFVVEIMYVQVFIRVLILVR